MQLFFLEDAAKLLKRIQSKSKSMHQYIKPVKTPPMT
ncbi:hypothetical protein [Acinetobacter phage Ab69]|nr:hypothetical protein [Acinetobacter phage Ab69]